MYSLALVGESSPMLTNVTFSGNAADLGGGMFNQGEYGGENSSTLTNVTFSGNAAITGTQLYNKNSAPILSYTLSLTGSDHIYNDGGIYTDTLVEFAASLSPNDLTFPYTYTIAYGDGETFGPAIGGSDPLVFNHTFAISGTYSVEFAAWNCALTAPLTDTVTVSKRPAAQHYIYLPLITRNTP